ncbi:hypothetical protein BpHYR1_043335 [Brachionus plicatilis]|uniref:Uncharacterized protein n=1 Tax=Brachionus plicatilis TaxID=10195 RepID=A0A3M7QI51_BRAPC|nr:hypothetical protein BpHYR1_043335 [Brachionus plicatilis]
MSICYENKIKQNFTVNYNKISLVRSKKKLFVCYSGCVLIRNILYKKFTKFIIIISQKKYCNITKNKIPIRFKLIIVKKGETLLHLNSINFLNFQSRLGFDLRLSFKNYLEKNSINLIKGSI